MNYDCPLCSTAADTFFEDLKHHFLLCPECHGIFRDPNQFLSRKNEKERYLHHRNDMEDQGYYIFILQIIDQVAQQFSKGSHGLDYLCGNATVLSNNLKKECYEKSVFDPIFFKYI